MTFAEIGLLFISIGLFFAVVFLLVRSRKSEPQAEKSNGAELLLIQNQMGELTRLLDGKLAHLDSKLGESSRQMNESVRSQFGESAKIIRDVTERLARLDETNRQVVGFADQLQSLQDILKNPKQRGVLGEYYLETVLKNVLPPGRFELQYKFPNGEIVDAAIFLDKKRVLPVDSKFSLENYNRIIAERDPVEREKYEKIFKQDLKNRIDETAKYIRPEEGTMDFAFMFIPSEAIYYDLLINQVGAVKTNTQDLIEYAFKQKRVIIVSPTSFLAYLQTVLQGLRSLEIEESAKEIIKRVGELEKHLLAYQEYHTKLGGALSTTINHYNATGKEFKKIDKDVLRITGVGLGVEIPLIDKPEALE